MKLLLAIALLGSIFRANASGEKLIIKSSYHKTKVVLEKKRLVFSSKLYKTEAPVSKCSELAIRLFIRDIEKEIKKALSLNDKNAITVITEKRKIKTPKRSRLSGYIGRLPDKALTLKKQILLSCKK